jgi:hypothetical protein
MHEFDDVRLANFCPFVACRIYSPRIVFLSVPYNSFAPASFGCLLFCFFSGLWLGWCMAGKGRGWFCFMRRLIVHGLICFVSV